MNEAPIPFNQPYLTGKEINYLKQALEAPLSNGNGSFAFRCEAKLQHLAQTDAVLLTHSCTNALELAAVLAEIKPGDEVILPSFTFTSTANAFALRGAKMIFVDIRPDTLNIDENAIEAAITSRTRAIIPVHYAGVACDMDRIMAIANHHGLLVVEDAAQSAGASYKGRALGSIGHLGAYSFHATKNISCGEGGALLVNDPALKKRAEIVHDKGTNRAQFRAGIVRQYEWVDIGMSAPPSELQAACLLAQLEKLDAITQQRISLWKNYNRLLSSLHESSKLRLLTPASECQHNGHIFAVIFNTAEQRNKAQHALAQQDIQTALHYQPLHLSPEGRRIGVARGRMAQSESLPSRLLRLPIWPGMPAKTCERVAQTLSMTLS